MAAVASSASDANEQLLRCCYVLPKKNRSCRMIVKKGQKYCGEHACFDPDNEFRIPCPNDPNHSVDKRCLEEHLQRCNSRLPLDEWVSKDVNKLDERPEIVDGDLTEEIYRASNIVIKEYEKIKDEIKFAPAKCELVEEVLSAGNVPKVKHVKQINSILGHLLNNGLLVNKSDHALLELGVGRGMLAYYMVKQAPEVSYVLVDYSGVKHKVDNLVKNEVENAKIFRIRCPIEHVDASKIKQISDASTFSIVCKHFCGSATDFGINLIVNAFNAKLPLAGFCLAPCCHHRIAAPQYRGNKFLKSIDIGSDSSTAALRQIASWATCGAPTTATSAMPSDDTGTIYKYWSYPKKLDLGRKAKALIEYGRVCFLRETLGFECSLLEYIDAETSPENFMIVGVRKSC